MATALAHRNPPPGPLARVSQSLRAGLKAARMTFSGTSASWANFGSIVTLWTNFLKDLGSSRSQGEGSSLIQACILWLQRTFPEAPLRVARIQADGTLQVDPFHPMAQLVRHPNPYYSGILLWMGTLAEWVLDGNAYWIKVYSKGETTSSGTTIGSRPVELWWTPSHLIEPKWPEDGSKFISHYEYKPSGKAIRLETWEVVHFRYGLDPLTRKGVSPLRSLLLELFTDQEASRFTAALLKNLGVPGVILAPRDPGVELDKTDAEALKETYVQKFSGDRRGEPMVLATPVSVQVLSFNPQQMEMGAARNIPEERVSAVLGIPAVVVGFGAGLARSTFTNYSEAREAAYEGNLIPTQRLFASEIDTQLLPDFGDMNDWETYFDLSQVRVLQDDQNKLHERAREDLKGGLLTLNRALEMVGEKQLGDAGEIRYIPGNVLPVRAGEEVPEPVERDDEEPTPLRLVPSDEDVQAAATEAAGRVAAEIQTILGTRLDTIEQRQVEDAATAAGRINDLTAAITRLDAPLSALAAGANGHRPTMESKRVERDADGLIARIITEYD